MSKEIDELKLQLEEMNNKIIELENKEKEESKKWWTPKEGEKYYHIKGSGNIENYKYDTDSCFDNDIIDNLNYYQTKEQAERKVFEQLLHRKLEKFAFENNEGEIDWNNRGKSKYYIYYDNYDQVLTYSSAIDNRYINQVYFTYEEIAEKCIEEFKDDLIRYFTTDK